MREKKLRIGIDIGGVISKFPAEFRTLIDVLRKSDNVEVYIITDMPRATAEQMLTANTIAFESDHLLCAEWRTHQDRCKSVLMEEHHIDIMIDDRLDYIMEGVRIGLMVVPRAQLPYESPEWKQ
jgi:hypothetical protein